MEIGNFDEARQYLESLVPRNVPEHLRKGHVGLERMKLLLEVMGNPQETYPTLHVGGTAGKGSTSTIIAAILEEAGYKTGLHVSPHLEDIRERMQVDCKLVSKTEFVNEVLTLRKYVEKVRDDYELGTPTYFEALLALAFEHFKRKKIDIGIIEVGLGGTFDGTNVIRPEVAVLTNVGLDHTEILGDTIEEIASDKVGIFKKGIKVVSGVTQSSVIKIVEKRAGEMNNKLDLLGREIIYNIKDSGLDGSKFDLKTHIFTYKDLETRLIGSHQVTNSALAIDATLNLRGFPVKENDIRKALSLVSVSGRFEIISKKPYVILDGAHNPMKIKALTKTLKENYGRGKINIVCAVKKRKNVKEMLDTISPMTRKFYFTRFQGTTDFGKHMSNSPEELQKLTHIESEVFDRSIDAYNKALKETPTEGALCVTGSLYLIGELKNLIKKK